MRYLLDGAIRGTPDTWLSGCSEATSGCRASVAPSRRSVQTFYRPKTRGATESEDIVSREDSPTRDAQSAWRLQPYIQTGARKEDRDCRRARERQTIGALVSHGPNVWGGCLVLSAACDDQADSRGGPVDSRSGESAQDSRDQSRVPRTIGGYVAKCANFCHQPDFRRDDPFTASVPWPHWSEPAGG